MKSIPIPDEKMYKLQNYTKNKRFYKAHKVGSYEKWISN